MKRNSIVEAVILKNYRIGEIHKGVILLTRSSGLIHAIAHGAYKGRSKLVGSTDPYNLITAYLYYEPVKKTYKISDADCKNFFKGIKNHLKKFYAASLCAEVIIKSFGGGEEIPGTAFALLVSCFGLLEKGDTASIAYILIQFIWRYVQLMGFQPELNCCAACGKIIGEKEDVFFSWEDMAFMCSGCAGSSEEKLSRGAYSYLLYTTKLSFERAVTVKLEEESSASLKKMMYRIMEEILESPLNTLSSSTGLL
ncbi:MAG: DNA repair protein RecO [Spirochaetota bacterium]